MEEEEVKERERTMKKSFLLLHCKDNFQNNQMFFFKHHLSLARLLPVFFKEGMLCKKCANSFFENLFKWSIKLLARFLQRKMV